MRLTWWRRHSQRCMVRGVESLAEIGGYFGLDLPDHGDAFPAAIKFQSGARRPSCRSRERKYREGLIARLHL